MNAISPASELASEATGRTLIHVVAGLAAEHGGPSYSVPRLCRSLAELGQSVKLLSVASAGDPASESQVGGYADFRYRWNFSGTPLLRDARWSTPLRQALRRELKRPSIVHSHGLWLMPNIAAGWAAERGARPHIISTRGMLSAVALGFSAAKKEFAWRMAQGAIVRRAACLHVTSEAECRDLRGLGLNNPVTVISNGIDIPELTSSDPSPQNRTVLFLGRIHAKKGIDRLLRAWAPIESRFSDWRLRIIGPSEPSYLDELRALIRSQGIERATIEPELYGEKKLAAYRAAALFVLPTLDENFGLTVAEALAAGTPAISTKGAPWSGLEAEGCGWWIDHGIESLSQTLGSAMAASPETLAAMGARGREWMEREFSWERVAREMLSVYAWLADKEAAPASVRFR